MLRKDFTVQEADVVDARLMGADAVLLIVAALDDDELGRCAARAAELGLAALVEVHDEAELERAPGRRGADRRGQPARPAHLRGGPRAGVRAGRATSRPT